MKKSWKLYAEHVLDCIDKIDLILARGDITKDDVLYDAALRNLQTMSEATRHLPDEKIKAYPDIPWKDISGFRNILVHNYLGDIDSQTVLNVIEIHVARLRYAVKEMVEEENNADSAR